MDFKLTYLEQSSRAISFQLILILLLMAGAVKAIAQPANDTSSLYFSAGWRPSSNSSGNVVQIGVLFRCHDGWCMDEELFDGRQNIQTVPISRMHEMHAPHRDEKCRDRAMTTVVGRVEHDRPVSVVAIDDGYVVDTEIGRYYWRKVGKTFDGRDRMELHSFIERGAAESATQVVGIAFANDNVNVIESLDQLAGRYDGEINHKDMNARPEDEWVTRRSIIDFSRFVSNRNDNQVRGFTTYGHPDVIAQLGKSLYVQHSITMLSPQTRRLKFLLHEYGHDFNGNGCLDEQAHNKLLLPVVAGGRVTELVYIEYTPDNRSPRDRVPMLSVGGYFLNSMSGRY